MDLITYSKRMNKNEAEEVFENDPGHIMVYREKAWLANPRKLLNVVTGMFLMNLMKILGIDEYPHLCLVLLTSNV